MESLYEYLITKRIQEDLSFLTEETIDEGKIVDGIKKAWEWIKGKFRRKKGKKKDGEAQGGSTENEIKIEEVKYNIYDYNQISEKIKKNNDLKKGIDIISKGYNNKYKIAVAEYKEDIIGCLFFITNDKYDRPQEFSEYKDYEHIFSMQIDKNHFNEGVSEGLLKKVLNEVRKYSGYKGITLDIKEYKTKPKLYEKYFEIKKNKDAEIGVYNK